MCFQENQLVTVNARVEKSPFCQSCVNHSPNRQIAGIGRLDDVNGCFLLGRAIRSQSGVHTRVTALPEGPDAGLANDEKSPEIFRSRTGQSRAADRVVAPARFRHRCRMHHSADASNAPATDSTLDPRGMEGALQAPRRHYRGLSGFYRLNGVE